MNNNKNNSQSVMSIGSTSLLVIFLILALVTFAVLTLTSANSDFLFSQRIASHNTDYYKAVAKAEMMWNEFNQTLDSEEKTAMQKEVDYTVKINDLQELQVVLTLTENDAKEYHYCISKWETVSTKKWMGDNSVKLIK